MKTFAQLLVAAAVALPPCRVGVMAYTVNLNKTFERDCAADLYLTFPVQKVEGGYLLGANYINDDPRLAQFVFLKTKRDLPEREMIVGQAVYAGQYEYVTYSGFTQRIPAFKEVTQ